MEAKKYTINNQEITEEIKEEIKKHLEKNDNENMMTHNLWDAAKDFSEWCKDRKYI